MLEGKGNFVPKMWTGICARGQRGLCTQNETQGFVLEEKGIFVPKCRQGFGDRRERDILYPKLEAQVLVLEGNGNVVPKMWTGICARGQREFCTQTERHMDVC